MEALNFAPSANLWQQQTRTLRHPALQNFMRPPRFAQRIDLTFSHVHFNHPLAISENNSLQASSSSFRLVI